MEVLSAVGAHKGALGCICEGTDLAYTNRASNIGTNSASEHSVLRKFVVVQYFVLLLRVVVLVG